MARKWRPDQCPTCRFMLEQLPLKSEEGRTLSTKVIRWCCAVSQKTGLPYSRKLLRISRKNCKQCEPVTQDTPVVE